MPNVNHLDKQLPYYVWIMFIIVANMNKVILNMQKFSPVSTMHAVGENHFATF